MSTIELNVEVRGTGKTICSGLRRNQKTPAVVYSKGQKNLYFCFEEKFAVKMKSQRHDNPTFEFKSDDSSLNGKKATIKEVVVHPVTRIPTHVDFIFA